MLRLLHTSDWHLGHTLHDFPRDEEHARFLQWLLETLEAERIDALLISGDVFDTANPSADAQRAWYSFIADACKRMPKLQVVVIGGNHDSPARLGAPEELFRALGVFVVGALPRSRGRIPAEKVLVPLKDASGEVAAWVAAVPYLRPADLPSSRLEGDEGDPQVHPLVDPLVEGVRRVYAEVLEAARARRQAGQALIALGHLYLRGTVLSEVSERKILGGNLHALPVDVFPEDVAYAALGHLHKAQCVGGRDGVRYSGSPLPFALDEAGYEHQVLRVELDGSKLHAVQALPVPRAVEIQRVPASGSAPLKEVLALLRHLPVRSVTPDALWPYLEVCVALDKSEPTLRRQLEEVLEGKAARLVKVSLVSTGDRRSLGDVTPGLDLRDLTPEQVFLRRYQKEFTQAPAPALLAAFSELVELAGREGT